MHKVTTERIAARVAGEADRILAKEPSTTTKAAVRSAVASEVGPVLRVLIEGIEEAAQRSRMMAAIEGEEVQLKDLPQWAQDGTMALRRRQGERDGG